jgi:hypothetical protein
MTIRGTSTFKHHCLLTKALSCLFYLSSFELVTSRLYDSFRCDTFTLCTVYSVIVPFVYLEKACLENQEMKPSERMELLKL